MLNIKTSNIAALVLFISAFFLTTLKAYSDDKDKEEIALLKTQLQLLQDRIKTLEDKYTQTHAAVVEAVVKADQEEDASSVVGAASMSVEAAAPDNDGSGLKRKIDVKKLEDEDPYKKMFKTNTPFLDVLPSYLTKGFEFHGYLRSGVGLNEKGGAQIAFKAPGADAKYRLGNEVETYGELAFVNKYHPEEINSAFFNVQVRLAFQTDEMESWAFDKDHFLVREAFVQGGNLGWKNVPDIKFWAGERFYQRHDIHINDYYVYDMSGYGGGFEDMNMPFWDTKLAVAYIGGSTDTYEFPKAGRVAKNTFDVRLSDIPVPLGKGTLWLAPSFVKGGTYTGSDTLTHKYPSNAGMALGFIHMHEYQPTGYNQLTGQWGFGTGSDFSPNIQDPTPDIRDSWRLRFTESNVVQLSEKWCMMSDVIYQVKDNRENGDSQVTWVSGGMRPIYNFGKHLGLAFEGGIDYVDDRLDEYEGMLGKLTIAPEIRIDNSFMGRPELRAYCTYAFWTKDFKGRVGGDNYAQDMAGLAFGVQAEAWW